MGTGARIKLGELLVRANLLTEAQLNTALAEQKRWGGKLGETLVRMSYVTEDVLVKALAKQLGLPRADLDAVATVPAAVLSRIPEAVAKSCAAVPLAVGDDGKSVVVAMHDPHNLRALDELRSVTGGARIVPYLAGPGAIAKAIQRFYGGAEALDDAEREGALRMVDAQGRAYSVPVRPAPPVPPPPRTPVPFAPPPAPGASTSEALVRLEEQQQRELQAIKTLVELLIERGVFSREEYLARVRR